MAEQIILSDSGKTIKPIEEGTYIARCIKMVDIGTVEEEFKNEKKTIRKVHLTWELPTELIEGGDWDGQPRVVSREYSASLNPKATLRKHLDAWRGKKFTEAEAKEFNLGKLLGVACQLTIIHNDKGYAKVEAISGVMKGVAAPDQIRESKIITVNNCHEEKENIPNFIWEKMITSEEYLAKYPPIAEQAVEELKADDSGEDGDLPF